MSCAQDLERNGAKGETRAGEHRREKIGARGRSTVSMKGLLRTPRSLVSMCTLVRSWSHNAMVLRRHHGARPH